MTILGLEYDPMLSHYRIRIQDCLEERVMRRDTLRKVNGMPYCSWKTLLWPLGVIPTPAHDKFQRILFDIFVR